MKDFPLNQILFGPPGTGKTYNIIDRAIEIIEQRVVNDEREDLVKSFNKYKEDGQIVFTTFHQSYGYEEFIEGLRSDDNGKFVPTNGIFKDLCEKAKLKKNQKSNFDFDEKTNNVFKMSLGNSANKEDDIIFDYCVENSVISLGKGGDIDYSSCKTRNEIESQYKNSYPNEINQDVSSMENFKLKLKTNDLVLISLGNKKIRAIARVTGDYFYEPLSEIGYKHFRNVEWIYTDVDIQTNDLFVNYKLMQKTLYPVDIDKLNLTKFKTLISKPSDEKSQNYVIIIDEINRGNMSKIFGELITLIEDDKREGAENELSVVLPYSKERFSIPANVYILGTMNTADRSIALLDTALRRRFTFIEMMPQTDLLQENVISGIDLSEFLTVINDRIEYLFDREHTIGHAYFINCNTFEELQQAMKNKVIPLLQEYFYDEWEKIELVLGGCGDENTKDNFFIYKKELKKDIFNKNSNLSDFTEENKAKYFVSPNPSKNAFLNLIGNENEGN